jgi:hypothetical protein
MPSRLRGEPSPDPKPPLLIDGAPIGHDLAPMAVAFSAEDARAYIRLSQRTGDPLFVGDRPRLHPGWLAGRVEDLLRHHFALPSSMHTASKIQHLARAEAGQTITTAARMIEVYERKGHHMGVFDCAVLGEAGAIFAQIRHTTIFRIAPPADRR